MTVSLAADGPRISVVVPVYNKARFLARTIASVLAQDMSDFELIVIDDGSTDGSVETLANIADGRLRIVRQANSGVAMARNAGIREARTEWVALIDADDLWLPDHLSELTRIISAYPTSAMVATQIAPTWTRTPGRPQQPREFQLKEIDYVAAATDNNLVVHSSAVAVRRDRALAIGGFRNLRPGQDIDCWVRMSLCESTAVSNRVTAWYVRDTGGIMDNWGSAKARKTRHIGSLREFGGAVQVLADALASGDYEARRPVFERYIDKRILDNAGRSIRAGDTTGARARLHFAFDKRSPRYLVYRALAEIPSRIVRLALDVRQRLRSRRRQRQAGTSTISA